MAEQKQYIFNNIDAEIGNRFTRRIGDFDSYDGKIGYDPKDESLWADDDDETMMVYHFTLAELKMTEKDIENIMKKSLEQNKDLFFPLVKPFAKRVPRYEMG